MANAKYNPYFVKFSEDGEPLEVFHGFGELEARYGVSRKNMRDLMNGWGRVQDPDPFLLQVDVNEWYKMRNRILERKRKERLEAERAALDRKPFDTELGRRMTDSILSTVEATRPRRFRHVEVLDIPDDCGIMDSEVAL